MRAPRRPRGPVDDRLDASHRFGVFGRAEPGTETAPRAASSWSEARLVASRAPRRASAPRHCRRGRGGSGSRYSRVTYFACTRSCRRRLGVARDVEPAAPVDLAVVGGAPRFRVLGAAEGDHQHDLGQRGKRRSRTGFPPRRRSRALRSGRRRRRRPPSSAAAPRRTPSRPASAASSYRLLRRPARSAGVGRRRAPCRPRSLAEERKMAIASTRNIDRAPESRGYTADPPGIAARPEAPRSGLCFTSRRRRCSAPFTLVPSALVTALVFTPSAYGRLTRLGTDGSRSGSSERRGARIYASCTATAATAAAA